MLASLHARLEEIAAAVRADARNAADVGKRRRRVAVVPRVERHLQLVAQAEVEREVRLPSPRVGDEEPEVTQPGALDAESPRYVYSSVVSLSRALPASPMTRPVSVA